MSERDDLAELLQDNITDSLPAGPSRGEIRQQVETAVDILIAAEYRKPCTVATIGTLPDHPGAVILTAHGKVMVLMDGLHSQSHWQTPNSQAWWSPLVEWLPATVLHEGTQS